MKHSAEIPFLTCFSNATKIGTNNHTDAVNDTWRYLILTKKNNKLKFLSSKNVKKQNSIFLNQKLLPYLTAIYRNLDWLVTFIFCNFYFNKCLKWKTRTSRTFDVIDYLPDTKIARDSVK